MKKILVGFSLLALSASANAFDFFDNNNGEWKMGPYGPYYEESDWPEWTPMYWMEEMMDSFDDDDNEYFGNMPFNNGNNFRMPFSNGSNFRMPSFNSGNGFRMPFSTNSYVPYGYGAATMMAPAPMPYGYGAAPMMRPMAPAAPMMAPQPAPQAPAVQANTKPGPTANAAQ